MNDRAGTNSLCIVGLVLSCLGLLLINLFGIVGVAGFICSCVGLSRCRSNGENGETCAVIGIILGFIDTIVAVITLGIFGYAYSRLGCIPQMFL